MKRLILLALLVASVGCKKKSDDPPPPPADTGNVSGTWSGPITYTYPVTGGSVTSVIVNANLAVTLLQSGTAISGSYTDSTGGSGTVAGSVQEHTFTGTLLFTPVGLVTLMSVSGTTMTLTVATTGVTGHGTITRSSASSSIQVGGF